MRALPGAFLLATVTFIGCSTHLTPARANAVEKDLRAFMGSVAHDITQEGPAAWRRYFADSPAFFMAVNGRLVFPNNAAATVGIQQVASAIKQIDLRWGDDVRVDPLSQEFAVVAASYHEVRVDTAGQRVEETGFFTATAEYRDGHWQFRNVHWSVPVPPAGP